MHKHRFIPNAVLVAGIFCFLYALISPPKNPTAPAVQDQFERIAQALEAYALDNNGRYPYTQVGFLPKSLSTPIAYISRAETLDPMPGTSSGPQSFRYRNLLDSYSTTSPVVTTYGAWIVASRSFVPYAGGGEAPQWPGRIYDILQPPVPYDATNGTHSNGVIFRTQRMLRETGFPQ